MLDQHLLVDENVGMLLNDVYSQGPTCNNATCNNVGKLTKALLQPKHTYNPVSPFFLKHTALFHPFFFKRGSGWRGEGVVLDQFRVKPHMVAVTCFHAFDINCVLGIGYTFPALSTTWAWLQDWAQVLAPRLLRLYVFPRWASIFYFIYCCCCFFLTAWDWMHILFFVLLFLLFLLFFLCLPQVTLF